MTQFADAMKTSPFPRLFVLDLLSDAERQSLTVAEEPASEPAHQRPLAAVDEAVKAAMCAEVIFIFLAIT